MMDLGECASLISLSSARNDCLKIYLINQFFLADLDVCLRIKFLPGSMISLVNVQESGLMASLTVSTPF